MLNVVKFLIGEFFHQKIVEGTNKMNIFRKVWYKFFPTRQFKEIVESCTYCSRLDVFDVVLRFDTTAKEREFVCKQLREEGKYPFRIQIRTI